MTCYTHQEGRKRFRKNSLLGYRGLAGAENPEVLVQVHGVKVPELIFNFGVNGGESRAKAYQKSTNRREGL